MVERSWNLDKMKLMLEEGMRRMTVRMMKNEVDVRGGDAEDDYIYDGDDNVFGGEDADGNLSTRYWSLSSLLSSSSLWCF